MNINKIDEIRKNLESVIIQLDPSLKRKLKERFTQFFSSILHEELELKLVIDANIIMSAGISKMKKGREMTILNSPHLKVFAPPEIKIEIEKHLEKVAKKQKLNPSELRENIDKILDKITILEPYERDLNIAIKMTKMRDVDDAPYVGLIFTTKSHGVMTYNKKDFSDLSGVEIIDKGETGKILTNFELGTFSFFILGTSATTINDFSKLIFKALSSIFSIILEVIKSFFVGVITLISKGIEGLSNLGWIAVVIVLAIGITVKEKITEVLQELWIKINQFFEFISESFKNIFNFLSEIFTIAIEFVSFFMANIQKSIELSYELRYRLTKE